MVTMTIEELQAQVEALMKRLDDQEERIQRHEDRTEGMSAKRMVDAANEWVAQNPDAWDYIIARAKTCVHDKKRFSIQIVSEEIRDSHLVCDWKDFKVNNSITAPLTRMLIERIPQLEDYVTIRKSKVDRFFS